MKYLEHFQEMTADILSDSDFQKLDYYSQHLHTSRLEHSCRVAYYSFRIARFLNRDTCSAARAGLLHDFYLYDKKQDIIYENHLSLHPKISLANSIARFNLTPQEKDAILNHMWPLTPNPPKSDIGWIVTIADKVAAAAEMQRQCIKFVLLKH
ncbi:HD domain-containing protein [[Clostridium] innocuum]|uniref:HD domain-containing protein n=1 Tax=Clostridium innocuum TaxID=1522 RepID=UPI000D6DAC7E|nr:HD domain-containing protein [[Clostridium] innocuum]MCR0316347.1 HD domain-containing protein [[Clostridium] innocuum]MCR0370926.1 HD domain-containing protein [[Clostridium] innocuum]MCR0375620.1 HD domain-containing protein [[Clostridium] innocuum]MCR0560902.1 HD domain-containing protein [[Clostridium] innocuum]MCR0603676.1 HD domain-containing protein [[Clostridium] innocuum]